MISRHLEDCFIWPPGKKLTYAWMDILCSVWCDLAKEGREFSHELIFAPHKALQWGYLNLSLFPLPSNCSSGRDLIDTSTPQQNF